MHLASLSFSELELIDRDTWTAEHVGAVRPDTGSPDWYFSERTLARWLATQELPSTVYAFPPLGVQTLRAAYRHLVERLDIDAVVLVDGGTDVLLRGDESDLGTPVEDITSLAARCLYLDRIGNTIGRRQVITRIQAFRDELVHARVPRAFPH